MSDFYFNPEEQEGSSFELLPKGDYVAEIVEAEIGQPKSLDGHMLKLTWKIIEGDFEGRQLWQQLCYQHSNSQTQDIARRMLKDICNAFSIAEQVTDPEVFKFKPAQIRVVVEADKSGYYDDQNRIRRVRALSDSDGEAAEAKANSPKSTGGAGESKRPAPKPAGNGPGAAPWKRPTA